MAGDRTTDFLVKSVRRRPLAPKVGSFVDDDVVTLLNEELQSFILPVLLTVNGEYLVHNLDTIVTAGTSTYEIPARAVGGKLRDVSWKYDNRYVSLQQTEPERKHTFSESGCPEAYYMEGNRIVLCPNPDTNGTARFSYYRRPNELVMTADCGKVATVSVGATTTSITVAGASYTKFANQKCDVVRGTGQFSWLAYETTPTSIGSTLIFQNSALPTVSVGDYVCLSETSCVPQIPQEMFAALCQRVSAVILAGVASPMAAQAEQRAQIMLAEVKKLLMPRSEGTGRVVINPNAPGVLYRGSKLRY